MGKNIINSLCRGKGKCGKCRVKILDLDKNISQSVVLSDNIRLACQVVPDGETDLRIQVLDIREYHDNIFKIPFMLVEIMPGPTISFSVRDKRTLLSEFIISAVLLIKKQSKPWLSPGYQKILRPLLLPFSFCLLGFLPFQFDL